MEQYRDDVCTCDRGVECEQCKQWRKKYRVRKPTKLKMSLQDQLKKAEGKLLQMTILNDRVRMKDYRAQVRMIQGRIRKAEEMNSNDTVDVVAV